MITINTRLRQDFDKLSGVAGWLLDDSLAMRSAVPARTDLDKSLSEGAA